MLFIAIEESTAALQKPGLGLTCVCKSFTKAFTFGALRASADM